MKRKTLLAILILCAAAAAALAVLFSGSRPYKNLTASDITYAEAYMITDNGTELQAQLTDHETLAALLRDVSVGRKAAFGPGNGSDPTFSLILVDGTCYDIAVKSPYVSINGQVFRAKSKPCEALEHYGLEQLGIRFELGGN